MAPIICCFWRVCSSFVARSISRRCRYVRTVDVFGISIPLDSWFGFWAHSAEYFWTSCVIHFSGQTRRPSSRPFANDPTTSQYSAFSQQDFNVPPLQTQLLISRSGNSRALSNTPVLHVTGGTSWAQEHVLNDVAARALPFCQQSRPAVGRVWTPIQPLFDLPFDCSEARTFEFSLDRRPSVTGDEPTSS